MNRNVIQWIIRGLLVLVLLLVIAIVGRVLFDALRGMILLFVAAGIGYGGYKMRGRANLSIALFVLAGILVFAWIFKNAGISISFPALPKGAFPDFGQYISKLNFKSMLWPALVFGVLWFIISVLKGTRNKWISRLAFVFVIAFLVEVGVMSVGLEGVRKFRKELPSRSEMVDALPSAISGFIRNHDRDAQLSNRENGYVLDQRETLIERRGMQDRVFFIKKGDKVFTACDVGNYCSGEIQGQFQNAGSGEFIEIARRVDEQTMVFHQSTMVKVGLPSKDTGKLPGTQDGWVAIADIVSAPEKKEEERPPQIYNSNVVVTTSTAIVKWATDKPADTKLEYGVGGLDQTKLEGRYVREHSVLLAGLKEDTEYVYRIRSRTPRGDEVESAIYHFRTEAVEKPKPAVPPPPPPVKNGGKRIVLDQSQLEPLGQDKWRACFLAREYGEVENVQVSTQAPGSSYYVELNTRMLGRDQLFLKSKGENYFLIVGTDGRRIPLSGEVVISYK